MATLNQDVISQCSLQVGMDVWLISQQWNTSRSDLASFPDLPLTKRVTAELSVSLPFLIPPTGWDRGSWISRLTPWNGSLMLQQSHRWKGSSFWWLRSHHPSHGFTYPNFYVRQKWNIILFNHYCFECLRYSIRTNIPNQTFSQSDSIENTEIYLLRPLKIQEHSF